MTSTKIMGVYVIHPPHPALRVLEFWGKTLCEGEIERATTMTAQFLRGKYDSDFTPSLVSNLALAGFVFFGHFEVFEAHFIIFFPFISFLVYPHLHNNL